MIPDKIYIAQTTFPDKIDWDGSPINTKRIEETDEEFVRKDALLEWAENWGKYNLRTDDGFLYAMELLANKLNSM